MKCRISGGLFAAVLFSLSALSPVNAQPTLTALHTFTGTSDGANPSTGLILSGNTLYGTAGGGSSGNGTVFKVNTNGTSFTNLYSFTKISGTYPYFTNSDGAGPNAVILSGDTLYGTAVVGGRSNRGTVFRVNTDGTSFTNLHSFTGGSDGAGPNAGVILSGNTLYGTAEQGGSSANGTVFAVNTNGTGFANLYSFTARDPVTYTNSDGCNPYGGLILSGNSLYGTAELGGSLAYGTLFALKLVPILGIAPAGNQVVLSWPTWSQNFGLQTTTNLSSGSWSNVTSGITTAGADYVFTNKVNSKAAFFRLLQQ